MSKFKEGKYRIGSQIVVIQKLKRGMIKVITESGTLERSQGWIARNEGVKI